MTKRVILIHGLSGFPATMKLIQRRFTKAGYSVSNLGYNARGKTFQQVAQEVSDKVDSICREGDTVNFVCHSMGGLIARYCIKNNTHPHKRKWWLHKIVTIGSPHEGAHWVSDIPFGHKIGRVLFGDKIVESLEDEDYFKDALPQLSSYKVMTIEGTKEFSFWNPLSWVITICVGGPHDGFVPGKGVHLKGSKRLIVKGDHLGMIANPKIIDECLRFVSDIHL